MRMYLVVMDVPFGDGSIDAHMDTTDGSLRLETGHIDPVDLKVTLDYDTAKAILVDGNPQVGMQAFMAGKVKVEGDMAKLMMMQGVPQDETAVEVAQRLREITA
jgi:putative sterol carrier protein